jgi:hypothetical protein
MMMPDGTTRHSPNPCLKCGYIHDSMSAVDGKHAPKEGDLTVCMGCAKIYQLRTDLTYQPLTTEEYDALPVSMQNQLTRVILAIRKVMQNKKVVNGRIVANSSRSDRRRAKRKPS